MGDTEISPASPYQGLTDDQLKEKFGERLGMGLEQYVIASQFNLLFGRFGNFDYPPVVSRLLGSTLIRDGSPVVAGHVGQTSNYYKKNQLLVDVSAFYVGARSIQFPQSQSKVQAGVTA